MQADWRDVFEYNAKCDERGVYDHNPVMIRLFIIFNKWELYT